MRLGIGQLGGHVSPAGQASLQDAGGSQAPPSQQVLQTAGALIERSAESISAAIRGGNAVEIARINAAARTMMDTLQRQLTESTNQSEVLRLQRELAALEQVRAATAAPPADNTKLYVALGVGGVVVLGLGYMLLRKPRNNPVLGRGRRRRYVRPGSRRRR